MNKKASVSTVTIVSSAALLVFLFIILSFVWYDVLDLKISSNFMIGMCFWIINCIILILIFPVKMMSARKIEIGFYVPIIMVTIIYTLLLWGLIAFTLTTVEKTFFVLMNLLLLFLYLLIVIPMIINGTNK